MTNFTDTTNLKTRAMLYPKTTDKYGFVDTDTLVERIRRLWDNVTVSYRGAYSRTAKTTRHIIEAKLLDFQTEEGVPMVYVQNSYNGESPIVVRIGFFRFICSNGLVVGREFFYQRIIHRKGQKVEQFLEDFDRILVAALDQVKQHLTAKIDTMKAIPVDYTKQRQIIEALTLPAKTKELAITLRTIPQRLEDQNNNVWTLYNTINEAIRIRSKSSLADYRKNDTLMEDVLRLAA